MQCLTSCTVLDSKRIRRGRTSAGLWLQPRRLPGPQADAGVACCKPLLSVAPLRSRPFVLASRTLVSTARTEYGERGVDDSLVARLQAAVAVDWSISNGPPNSPCAKLSLREQRWRQASRISIVALKEKLDKLYISLASNN